MAFLPAPTPHHSPSSTPSHAVHTPGSSFCPLFRPSHVRRAVPLQRLQRPSVPFAPSCCTASSTKLDELRRLVVEYVAAARQEAAMCGDVQAVDKVRVKFLGKKGSVTSILKSLGSLPSPERPVIGAAVNAAKGEVLEIVNARKKELEEERVAREKQDNWIDVTMPGLRIPRQTGRTHPITSTMDRAVEIFVELGYDLIDDLEYNKEIEDDYYCFTALNCPEDHPAREMQDTFYLTGDKKKLLRTQTSAVQIRYMEKNEPPFRIIAPGRVYRRDTSDATHSATFHQIEILNVEKIGNLTLGHLKGTVEHYLEEMLGKDIKTRFRGSFFPFTEPSMEVDVFFRGRWLEVLGCGMVDPNVLQNVGLDPNEWAGFAAGFGVERFAMVMHEIEDIRELYKSDSRFLSQGLL